MKKFEFVDITTADVAFIAHGKDLNELFENSAIALFEVMVDTEKVEKKVKKTVEVEGDDLESMMFSWLNELLFLYGSEGLVFSLFKVSVDLKGKKVKGECFGEYVNPEKHEVKTEVKAVTFHKLSVWKDENWNARVILDI